MAPSACPILAKRSLSATLMPQPLVATVWTHQWTFLQKTVLKILALLSLAFTMLLVQVFLETLTLLVIVPWGTLALFVKLPLACVTHTSVGMEALARMHLVVPPVPVLKDSQVYTVKLTLTNAFPLLASMELCAETRSGDIPAIVSQVTKESTVTGR
ncbi:hypothetical protein NXF25_008805 [Crotalus adamanteus]|uniref:Uncharacterized protein n=1 Tax=Crotalus adamanteus TaxID=8729 RepID=A0AAW1BPS2_CROAD